MEISKRADGESLILALSGKLDTITAPDLEAVLKQSLNGTAKLIFDFTELEYISSAGLRVLLEAQKTMNGAGQMVIRNVSGPVMEVFEITGFKDLFTMEQAGA